MAVVLDEEQDDDLGGQDGVLLNEGAVSLDAGSMPSGGAQGPNMAQGGIPNQAGGEFVDSSQLLQQNQPAAQRLGGQLADRIRGVGDSARTTIDSSQQGFNALVDQNTVNRDEGIEQGIAENPVSLANDPAQLERVAALRQAAYGGPAQLEDSDFFSPIAEAVGNVDRTRDLSGTSGGRVELLQDIGRRGSIGSKRLDESLIQADDIARGGVDSARTSLDDVNSRVEQASAASRERANAARTTTDATREATIGALTNATNSSQEGIDQRLTQTRQDAADRIAALQGAFGPLSALPTSGQAGLVLANPDDINSGLVQGTRGVPVAFNKGVTGQPGGVGALREGFGGYLQQREGERQLNDQQLADLGISREQWEQLNDLDFLGGIESFTRNDAINPYNVLDTYEQGRGDFDRYLTFQSPDAAANRENVASKEDFDRLAALGQLSGQQNTFLDQSQIGQAGTFDPDLTDFDFDSALAQVNAARDRSIGLGGRAAEYNSRSGSDSFIKKVAPTFLDGRKILNHIGGAAGFAYDANKALSDDSAGKPTGGLEDVLREQLRAQGVI